MIKAYAKYWQNFFKFSGRTRRKDYWLAIIASAIVTTIVTAIISRVFAADGAQATDTAGLTVLGKLISGIWAFINVIPTFSLSVRRMHDVDKRGWFLLWSFVPLIGDIIVLIKELTAGTVGANRFGADPKTAAIEG